MNALSRNSAPAEAQLCTFTMDSLIEQARGKLRFVRTMGQERTRAACSRLSLKRLAELLAVKAACQANATCRKLIVYTLIVGGSTAATARNMCSLGQRRYVRTNVSDTSTVPIARSKHTMHPNDPEITFLSSAPAAAPGQHGPWPRFQEGPFLIVPFGRFAPR